MGWYLLLFVLTVVCSLLMALFLLAFRRHLLCPISQDGCVFTVIPLEGEGQDMETTVAFFSRYGSGRDRHYILLLDKGLSEAGKACALLLATENTNVYLSKGDNLYPVIHRLAHSIF